MWKIIMPNYTLKHKDHNLCTFALNRHQIDYAAFKKASLNELPLPLWRVFNYKEEFIEYETEDFLFANEEGCHLLENCPTMNN